MISFCIRKKIEVPIPLSMLTDPVLNRNELLPANFPEVVTDK